MVPSGHTRILSMSRVEPAFAAHGEERLPIDVLDPSSGGAIGQRDVLQHESGIAANGIGDDCFEGCTGPLPPFDRSSPSHQAGRDGPRRYPLRWAKMHVATR